MSCFNLLDENWILVEDTDAKVHEVSLLNLFENAHKYRILTGETPQQDAAMMRFLLAIMHSVMGKYTADGGLQDLKWKAANMCLSRWNEYWTKGSFSSAFKEYLESYHDYFWLVDEKFPFYQNADILNYTDKKKEKSIQKIIGEVHASERQYQSQYADDYCLDYAEAARWLVYYKAYSTGPNTNQTVGWLVKHSAVILHGANLFETLLLNTCLLRNGSQTWNTVPYPSWEYIKEHQALYVHPETEEFTNLADFYTQFGTKILLHWNENNQACGVWVTKGNSIKLEDTDKDADEQETSAATVSFEPEFDQMTYFDVRNGKKYALTSKEAVWKQLKVQLTKQGSDFTGAGSLLWLRALLRRKYLKEKKFVTLQYITSTFDQYGCKVIDMNALDIFMTTKFFDEQSGNGTICENVVEALNICDSFITSTGIFYTKLWEVKGCKETAPKGVKGKELATMQLEPYVIQYLNLLSLALSKLDSEEETESKLADILYQNFLLPLSKTISFVANMCINQETSKCRSELFFRNGDKSSVVLCIKDYETHTKSAVFKLKKIGDSSNA
jgi:CRISPR system Cascade subunit CasA